MDGLSTKEMIEQEELVSMKVDESMLDRTVSIGEQVAGGAQDGAESTCNNSQQFVQIQESSSNHSEDDRLLSITNLIADNSNQDIRNRRVSLIPVNYPKQSSTQDYNNPQEIYVVNLPAEADDDMYSRDQLEISPNNIHELNQFKEFKQVKPRLSYASQKMKDYFDSFKSHGGEKARLYQFFKSIRTELVACLLFTLITSHALIVCRTNLGDNNSNRLDDELQIRGISALRREDLRAQLGVRQSGFDRRAAVQLISGLVKSLTVASLIQVFGHVSGCHLVPSISLALYVKGHISRARLISYLVAQFTGSLIGVALLGLLTTSQLTISEYREILQSHQHVIAPIDRPFFGFGRGVNTLRDDGQLEHHVIRNRRQVDLQNNLIDVAENFSSDPSQASETILLSIEELQQKQRRQLEKRNQISNEASAGSAKVSGEVHSDVVMDRIDKLVSSSLADSRLNKSTNEEIKTGSDLAHTRSSQMIATGFRSAVGEGRADKDEISRISKRTNKIARSEADDNDKSPPEIGFRRRHSGLNSEDAAKLRDCDRSKLSDSSEIDTSSDNKPIKLRRRKRNRQLNSTANLPPTDTSLLEADSADSSRLYINLLGLSLPDPIMSSESIRECIELQANELHQRQLQQQRQQQQQQQQPQQVTIDGMKKRLAKLDDIGFEHCLSLSNSSQMFVFQLLATLIIVLTYLVNVDPRRIDLGFKSLSIGLSYFVANALAIQSGGFFGNPFHLLCLCWFSQATSWQPEWFIYLVTPLIGGLFGALSHEYIDFTSAQNCNKQLHLRRSFYSLDNLQQVTTNGAAGNQATSTSGLACASAVAGALTEMRPPLLGRRAPSSPNGSVESIEVLSSVLNSPNGNNYLDPSSSCKAMQIKSNANRKFESYSRQLRLEQRQAKVAHLQCAVKLTNESTPTAAAYNTIECSPLSASHRGDLKRIKATQLLSRPNGTAKRSRYEPNFLISSSPTERHLNSKTSVLM